MMIIFITLKFYIQINEYEGKRIDGKKPGSLVARS